MSDRSEKEKVVAAKALSGNNRCQVGQGDMSRSFVLAETGGMQDSGRGFEARPVRFAFF